MNSPGAEHTLISGDFACGDQLARPDRGRDGRSCTKRFLAMRSIAAST